MWRLTMEAKYVWRPGRRRLHTTIDAGENAFEGGHAAKGAVTKGLHHMLGIVEWLRQWKATTA